MVVVGVLSIALGVLVLGWAFLGGTSPGAPAVPAQPAATPDVAEGSAVPTSAGTPAASVAVSAPARSPSPSDTPVVGGRGGDAAPVAGPGAVSPSGRGDAGSPDAAATSTPAGRPTTPSAGSPDTTGTRVTAQTASPRRTPAVCTSDPTRPACTAGR